MYPTARLVDAILGTVHHSSVLICLDKSSSIDEKVQVLVVLILLPVKIISY